MAWPPPAPIPTIPGVSDFDPSRDWCELLYSPTTSASFGLERSATTLTGTVESAKLYACVCFHLGINFVDYSAFGSPELVRRPPALHPKWKHLMATSVVGIHPLGLATDEIPRTPAGGGPYPLAGADKFEITIDFSPVPWIQSKAVAPAGVTPHEYYRFTSTRVTDSSDLLKVEAGAFRFTDGPTAGNPITAHFAYPVNRENLILRWHDVPLDWVCTPLGQYKRAVGKRYTINKNACLDYPEHTLQLTSIEFEPRPSPLLVDMTASSGFTYQRLTDIVFTFTSSDPEPKGNPSNGVAGYDLALSPFDLKWWAIERANGTSGGPWPESDFDELFMYRDAP